jgi:uncharacterized protein YndB with AHSA1/START domain
MGAQEEPGTLRIERVIAAPRERVYAALIDPEAIPRWRVPREMRAEVHELDAREGGGLRVSLTYDAPDRAGKTAGRTDTYRGRFARLVPGELVVEVDEFETDDVALQGEMTMTFRLSDAGAGTRLVGTHEGVPAAISPADNAAGWREALDRLAALLERPG